VERLTSVEIEDEAAVRLRERFGERVTVHTGSATALPLNDDSADVIVCCTMLHHVPTTLGQDQILAEAARVLRPGGVLTGSDSKTDLRFRLFHLFDIHNPVHVAGFERRLLEAGFAEATVTELPGRFRFRAVA
jgi:ubiquinone/menaquinone biosynthesis C-methylase UbiE